MAKYVEHIKVGSGETWDIRDKEAYEFINETLADYPVETGVSGIWSYTKWNSGRYVATYITDASTETVDCSEAFGSVYLATEIKDFQLPSFSKSLTHYSGSASLVSNFSSAFMFREEDYILLRFWSPVQVPSSAYRVSLKIEGTWK